MASNPCTSPSSDLSGEKTKRRQVYPMAWASSVVCRALKSHPRAWEIVLEILGISSHHLAILLASQDPDWPRIREFCHTVDRWLAQQARVGPSGQKILDIRIVKLCLGDFIRRLNFSESLKKYLTGTKNQLKLVEQGFEGDPEASAEGSPHLFPPGLPSKGVQLGLDLDYVGRCQEGACASCQSAPQCQSIRR